MSSTAATFDREAPSPKRIDVLFDEVGELTGQRNAIDGRLAEIVAEIDHDGLWGATGCRSLAALVAWKTGMAPRNAEIMVAVAHRLEEFPRCAQGLREGRVSLDQLGVIAERAGAGSDAHYAQLISIATVTQLRTAVKLEPRPQPDPTPEPQRRITRIEGPDSTTWRITLPRIEAAKFDAALQSHRDAVIADWKRDREPGLPDDPDPDNHAPTNRQAAGDAVHPEFPAFPEGAGGAVDHSGAVDHPAPKFPTVGSDAVSEQAPPFPDTVDAFMHLIDAGWDSDAATRPHGARTTVIVHLDAEKNSAALHLGPLLTDEERRYLLCDATTEIWLERHGQPIGAGRATRTINRRLRRALEHRDQCCVVPGCGATRGLHAHHLTPWEDGGPTDLDNLVLLCPYHHRLHHRGGITLTGPAHRLKVTDEDGQPLHPGSLARPPTTPAPDVPPCPGPLGERADWWWYTPFEPQAPPTTN